METKKYIAYFLFFIGMTIPTAPVIPHHHHEDGVIRMKDDLPLNGCCRYQDVCNEHRRCDTGCMITHLFQQIPNPNNSDVQSCFVWATTLFAEPPLKLSTLSDETGIR